ncbi:MAG: metallophosphoesterase [Acidobacteria bacterium]|nr:metallophosphoesterase [Acidobacteriota bacterium]
MNLLPFHSKITSAVVIVSAALACALLQPDLRAGAKDKPAAPTFSQIDDEPHSGWTVVAYGDTRFTDPANVIAVNPQVRRWLVQKIADEKPDVLLLSGDLPYTGSDAHDYAVFREETRIWRDHHIHLYPALGNHELKGGEDLGLANWWATFPQLSGKRWYSVSFRSAFFICLDSNASLTEGSEQRRWFDQQIASLPADTQFVFVVQHHPPIADLPMDPGHTPQENEIAFAHHLEEKARNLRAQFIVIAGHIHNYERFKEQGVDFLISGGGGAKPHLVIRGPDDRYQQSTFPNYHYVKFVFDGKHLRASMVRVANPLAEESQWETRDNFVIEAR